MDLMSSRSTGMSPGPIWWSTIQTYGVEKGLDEEQIDSLHVHINAMDTYYLKQMMKKK